MLCLGRGTWLSQLILPLHSTLYQQQIILHKIWDKIWDKIWVYFERHELLLAAIGRLLLAVLVYCCCYCCCCCSYFCSMSIGLRERGFLELVSQGMGSGDQVA